MAVGHILTTQSHSSGSASTNQASFNWSHANGGTTPRGVLVYTFHTPATGDIVTNVTYGGVALTAVPGGRAADTATEPGDCKAWFLGSGIPTGTQTVEVTRTNNSDQVWATATTVSADDDTEVVGTTIQQENGTFAAISVNDGSTGVNSMRFAGGYSGGANILSAATGSTVTASNDLGNYTDTVCRESTAGQGARNVGFTFGTSDDRAYVALAVREVFTSVNFDAVGPSSSGQVSATNPTSPLTWTHVNGADATGLVVFVAVGKIGDSGITVSVTYNGVAMTGGTPVHSAGGTAGYLRAFTLLNPATGSNTVSVSWTGSPEKVTAGSISVTNAGSFNTQYSNTGAGTTTATATSSGSTNGSLIVAGVADGGGTSSATSPSTSRFIANGDSNSGAGNCAGATSPGTGSNVTTAWTISNDDYAVIGIEVLLPTGGDATATPGVVSGSVTIPAPTPSAGSTAAPAVVQCSTAIPTPTVSNSGDASASPAVVAGSATIPAPTVSAGSKPTPSVVQGTASIPAPTVSASSRATPGVVSAVTSIPAPAVSAGSTASPSAVQGTTSFPARTLSAGSMAGPATVLGTTSIPTPSVSTGGDAFITPAVVACTTSIPAPTASASSRATPGVVQGSASISSPSIAQGQTIIPALVAALAVIPAPTVVALGPVTYGTASVTSGDAATSGVEGTGSFARIEGHSLSSFVQGREFA